MQVHIDLLVNEKTLDLVAGAGTHKTSQRALLGLVVDEAHECGVLDVLGVLDHAGGDLAENLEGLLDLLLGEVLAQVACEDVLFVLEVLVDRSQVLYAVGLLLGPVHIDVASGIEWVHVLHFFVCVVRLRVVLETDERKWQALVRVGLHEQTRDFTEPFAGLSKSILYFLFGQLRQVFNIKVI